MKLGLGLSISDVAGGGFSIDQLSGVDFYYDASDESSISHAAGLVSSISNQISGSSFGAATNSGAAATKLNTGVNTINGLNTLYADGSNEYITLSNYTSAGDFTMIVVAEILAVDATLDAIFSYDSTTDDFQYDSDNATEFQGKFRQSGLADVSDFKGTGDYVGPSIHILRFNQTNGIIDLHIDGTYINETEDYTGDLATTADIIFPINRGLNSQPECNIGAVIGCSAAITDDEINSVNALLGSKWGITVSEI